MSLPTYALRILAWMLILFWAAPSAAESIDGSSIVYIARRGWHIDIGLAAADLTSPLDSIAADLPDARYLFFGFGDQHYLLAKNHHAPAMLAALWPGAALMLVTGLSGAPDDAFGADHVISLRVSNEQLLALRSFIWKSMDSHEGVLNVYQSGPYEGSVYYLATAKYSAFHTCNTWGAQALQTSGLQVHSGGIIFAGQLWSQAKRLKREQTAPLRLPSSGSYSLLISFGHGHMPDIDFARGPDARIMARWPRLEQNEY